jgi:hypothetical protein
MRLGWWALSKGWLNISPPLSSVNRPGWEIELGDFAGAFFALGGCNMETRADVEA